MSSKGITQSVERRRGFSQRAVEEFRLLGQTQSVAGGGPRRLPAQRERVISRESSTGRLLADTGFKGAFAKEGQEDINRLLETFQNRRNFILGRKRAPGRSALLLVNR